MANQEARPRCQAFTQEGQPCKNPASPGSDYCRVHQRAAIPPQAEIPEQEQRRQMASHLDRLIRRLRATAPEYRPPPFSRQRLIALMEKGLEGLPASLRLESLGRLRQALLQNWFQPDTWKGIWYMLNYTVQYNAGMLRRRYTGEYETDAWGLDQEFLDLLRPLLTFLYRVYWRVETTGVERIPIEGPTLLVANHSGLLPWDGLMVGTAVLAEHPAQRLVRTLYADWVPTIPFLSGVFAKLGQTLDTVENGARLLEQGELVAVYPEGDAGAAKLLKDRYKLARFGQGDFVKMALMTGAPILPVSVVGAEETYLTLARSSTLARLTRTPYFPISPTFPWLGLLGLVPLPTKWAIDFGEPIPVERYGPGAASNLVLVSQLSDRVRNTIQEMLHQRLAKRRSAFF